MTMNNQVFIQKLELIQEKFDGLTQALSDPKIIADQAQFQRLAKERADLEEVMEQYRQFKTVLKEIEATEEMLRDARAEAGLREMAEQERRELSTRKDRLEQQLRRLLLPRGRIALTRAA